MFDSDSEDLGPNMTKKIVVIGIAGLSLLYLLYTLLMPPRDPETAVDSAPRKVATQIVSGVLSRTETFYESLKNRQVPAAAIDTLISHLSDLVDFRRCKPGTRYDLHLSPLGEVVQCSYYVSPIEVYRLKKEKETYSTYKEDVALEKYIVKFSGEMRSSLFESFGDSGESDQLALVFAEIFASEIDFNTEPQPGDRFTLVFEKYLKEDQFAGYGRILAARYEAESEVYEAFYYAGPKEKGLYYDSQGKSLSKHFLRSPVPFSRLTSGFSRRRKHPILGVYRPHLGIDLAAPTGTPILAAADGVIVSRGWRRGYGRQVIIKHSGAYTTYYGHLSRFAAGAKPQARVKQGQAIGFVGATGLATGPHLDYRIKEKEVFRNPFSLRFKPKTVLKGPSLDRYLARKEEMFTIMGMASPRYEKRLGICKTSQASLI